jgi:tetratricopeptide (TPR) repeat protein
VKRIFSKQKPKKSHARDHIIKPLLERLSRDRQFLHEILEIRVAALDKTTHAMPDTPLSSIALDMFPPDIKCLGLNYDEVTLLFIGAAMEKMKNDGSEKVYVHPFEILPPPETCDHWLGKAKIIANQGLLMNALKCCEKALVIDSKNAPAWSEKGDILFYLAEMVSPPATFSEKPSTSRALSMLSGSKARYEEVLQCYEHAISIDPKCLSAIYSKGACLIEIGRPTQDWSKVRQAIECFESVLRIDPSHENAKIALKMCRDEIRSKGNR